MGHLSDALQIFQSVTFGIEWSSSERKKKDDSCDVLLYEERATPERPGDWYFLRCHLLLVN